MLSHAGRRSRHLSSRVQQTLGHRPDVKPQEALEAIGAGKLRTLWYGVMPQVMQHEPVNALAQQSLHGIRFCFSAIRGADQAQRVTAPTRCCLDSCETLGKDGVGQGRHHDAEAARTRGPQRSTGKARTEGQRLHGTPNAGSGVGGHRR